MKRVRLLLRDHFGRTCADVLFERSLGSMVSMPLIGSGPIGYFACQSSQTDKINQLVDFGGVSASSVWAFPPTD